jgi:hypothetical protein
VRDAKVTDFSAQNHAISRLFMGIFPCVLVALWLTGTPGAAADLPAAVARDPVAQTWNQAYQKLRKSPRSSEDYKDAVKTVSPALKVIKSSELPRPAVAANTPATPGSMTSPIPFGAGPDTESIMDPDQIPRIVTFGKHGTSEVESREPQVAPSDGAVGEIEFGGTRTPAYFPAYPPPYPPAASPVSPVSPLSSFSPLSHLPPLAPLAIPSPSVPSVMPDMPTRDSFYK